MTKVEAEKKGMKIHIGLSLFCLCLVNVGCQNAVPDISADQLSLSESITMENLVGNGSIDDFSVTSTRDLLLAGNCEFDGLDVYVRFYQPAAAGQTAIEYEVSGACENGRWKLRDLITSLKLSSKGFAEGVFFLQANQYVDDIIYSTGDVQAVLSLSATQVGD